VVIAPDDQHIFTGSKDCTIIKWNMKTMKKVKVIPRTPKLKDQEKCTGHSSHVLCLAITTDNQLLASGDRNKLILLWQPETCELLHVFTGHRDAVTGLAFRRGTHQLFSASMDRSVKIWNADEMAYVETLFGHQSVITGIDSLTRERAVTSGGSDGSVRIWKVIEESQLVFHGHSGAIDCVSLIDEEHFISGANDNSLAVWSVMKKKPIALTPNAHSTDGKNTAENWISSVTSLTYTDLVASGSKDGEVRLWQCAKDFRKLTPLLSIPLPGFINGLKFSSDGSFLVAAVGQEHSLGRWWSLKHAKNSLCIINLQKSPT
jgi:ribosomal RNA-processing protein 9